MSDMGFESEEELELIFETDKPFSEETAEQTIGRLLWLTVRRRAELLLYMLDHNIPLEHAAKVIVGYDEIQVEYYDFILVGLGKSRQDARLEHPMEAPIDSLVDSIVRSTGATGGVTGIMDVTEILSDLIQLTDEDLIHRLQGLKDSLSPRQD
jgi:hypothetical protein